MKILGLRVTRLQEWWRVVREEMGHMTWRETIEMWSKIVWEGLRVCWYSKTRRNDSRAILARYRTCQRCPVFDKELKRCRPFTGATLSNGKPIGCGCYVPYLVHTKGPCWARRHDPEAGWD